MSQPARAVWIEMLIFMHLRDGWSQPARAVWIEIIVDSKMVSDVVSSQPARAVWIEIPSVPHPPISGTVTACEGCVD